MKQTLLELTQDVLNAIDGEEVNVISETIESIQVSQDIKNVYYDLIGRKDWQFLRKLRTLASMSDSDRPTHMLLPEKASKIDFINYNKKKVGSDRRFFQPVKYMFPDEFLQHVNNRDNTKSNYDLVEDVNGVILTIRNDAHPEYYTSFDDIHVVFDNYDSAIEDTLKESNTQMSIFIIPDWEWKNEFVPELPTEMFPLLLAEAKTYCQARKDDTLLQKTEQTAMRHQRHLSQTHGVLQAGVRYPDYGRNGPKMGGSGRRPKIFGPRS